MTETLITEKALSFTVSSLQNVVSKKQLVKPHPPYFLRGITFNKKNRYQFNTTDDAPLRIHNTLPATKIIISLRNPVHRAHSQYWKNRRQGRETARCFHDAIIEELKDLRKKETSETCWIYNNKYSIHIKHWFTLFPSENIKILIFEEWINDPSKAMRELSFFLNIDSDYILSKYDIYNAGFREKLPFISYFFDQSYFRRIKETRIGQRIAQWNRISGYPKLDFTTHKFVQHIFEPDIFLLEDILSRNLNIWREI